MPFDPQAATAAYIDSLGADALAKAAAYTAGNHWLLLWGLVVSAIFTWVIVRWGILDRLAARLARRGVNLRAFVVAATLLRAVVAADVAVGALRGLVARIPLRPHQPAARRLPRPGRRSGS